MIPGPLRPLEAATFVANAIIAAVFFHRPSSAIWAALDVNLELAAAFPKLAAELGKQAAGSMILGSTANARSVRGSKKAQRQGERCHRDDEPDGEIVPE